LSLVGDKNSGFYRLSGHADLTEFKISSKLLI